ncbi:uncharacterized protein LOC143893407 isoform X1 [Temnothorax americanus]|uniref:uncharacterized protein LOC143893407 isoform X1 n=1 Tax=Temnothorax americanus TaxID=1964332 RepID=UPI0040693CD8
MSEMIELNWMICNKCFAPLYRGKRPYHVTQCGHISCQNCLRQVEQQCPQCQHGTMALALEEPLMPRLIPYFQPLAEIVEMQLMKVDTFRSNQMKILMHRFIELDKKYELLKTRFFPAQRNLKALADKYTSVTNEKNKLEKKLMFYQTHKVTPLQSAYRGMETLPDSGISVPTSYSSGCSMKSSDRPKSMIATPTSNGLKFTMDVTPIG